MPEVDGNYPNYPVVFPIDAAKPAVSPTLSFEMFGDLAKVVKLLGTPHGPSGGTLYQYPNMGPLYIAAQWSHDIDMVAIIMPMRDATEYGRELNVPPWARTFVQKPEAKPEEPRDIAAVSTPEPHPAEA